MKQAGASKPEKELWQQDWDDEEVGEDFAAKLRQQLAKSKWLQEQHNFGQQGLFTFILKIKSIQTNIKLIVS